MTIERPLEQYGNKVIAGGAAHAIVTQPSRVVTAPWVRWKCQFGCDHYGQSHLCPPHTPTPDETRRTLDSYNRAILFHLQWTKGVQSGRVIKSYFDNIIALEREMFLDGFYRAFALIAGYCFACKDGCAVLKNAPCRFPAKVRPSMESCGIDVFQTAHNHGMPLVTLRTEEETRNIYSLLLVD